MPDQDIRSRCPGPTPVPAQPASCGRAPGGADAMDRLSLRVRAWPCSTRTG